MAKIIVSMPTSDRYATCIVTHKGGTSKAMPAFEAEQMARRMMRAGDTTVVVQMVSVARCRS